MRCAPFSFKNRRFPRGCWAALRELQVVMQVCPPLSRTLTTAEHPAPRAGRCPPTPPQKNSHRSRQGVSARTPTVVIYENTHGLLRRVVWRRRVETVLWRDRRYDWECVVVTPERNCGVPVRRKRAYYVGILRVSNCARRTHAPPVAEDDEPSDDGDDCDDDDDGDGDDDGDSDGSECAE